MPAVFLLERKLKNQIASGSKNAYSSVQRHFTDAGKMV